MDKLDVWIYIILFVVIPIVNSLLGSKKKREAKNVRPESPQPKKKRRVVGRGRREVGGAV